MKNEMILSNGVKIQFTKNGVNVISSDGEIIRFDNAGRTVFNKAERFIKYFDFMGSQEQNIAREWAEITEGKTDKQNEFIKLVKESGTEIKEEYYIANIEPSLAKTGKIYYKKGQKVACCLSCNEWKQKAREFAPELGSDLASKYQLALWYAYRIAKGFWTISYVCDCSMNAGNYWSSWNATHSVEPSGARVVGRARDGVGNTYKIVTDGSSGFCQFGGCYYDYGRHTPVTCILSITCMDEVISEGSGVLVLKEVHGIYH